MNALLYALNFFSSMSIVGAACFLLVWLDPWRKNRKACDWQKVLSILFGVLSVSLGAMLTLYGDAVGVVEWHRLGGVLKNIGFVSILTTGVLRFTRAKP